MTPGRASTDGGRSGTVLRPVRWLFRNRQTGRYTVAQWPNVALSVFILAAVVMRVFHPAGVAGSMLRWVRFAALVVWAVDEIGRGVSPFRRFLGGAVLATTLVLTFR